MTDTLADQAIEILQKTSDGDDLDPGHLKLLELAVDGRLNIAGKGAFAALLASVRSGYVKPWFHGVEHLTRDQEGYVYWKGNTVEHITGNLVLNDEGKAYALELARRCAILEAQGLTPTTRDVVWTWPSSR
jgi:hypothetical protein